MVIRDILNMIESHLLALGIFDTVNMHEPKKAPGNGLHVSVWGQSSRPIPGLGGLTKTSMRLEFKVRMYLNMLMEPQDAIDPALMDAMDSVMSAYSGDFTLGGTIRNVDLLGAHGQALSMDAGYLDHDGRKFRVYVITLPLIVDDVWTQSP
jgi:hypothetical protein